MKDQSTEQDSSSKRVLRPRPLCQPKNIPAKDHRTQQKATAVTAIASSPQKLPVRSDVNDNVWKPRKINVSQSKSPDLIGFNPPGLSSGNIVYNLSHTSLCTSHFKRLKQAVVVPYIKQLFNLRIQNTASPFDRRVTALDWHPTLPKTLAVASKSGDLVLWNYEKTAQFDFSKGVGKGGAITSMTFDLTEPDGLYTSSNEGSVCRHCFSRPNSPQVFLHTHTMDHWYCSVAVNYSRNLLLAGDNRGNLTMMDRNMKNEQALWTRRLHKSKATHCEFNHRCDWLVATASTDKTVKMWDLRMMSDRKSALYVLPHERPINSAYFSPDSTRLLTTDQNSELRIYAAPQWDRIQRCISHPHRFFQHLTPIKATWHPLHDLVVVGRYPDEKFPTYSPDEKRSIDIFDANSGDLVCQLVDENASGIVSLNKFSPFADSLASGMGYTVLIWTDALKRQLIQSEKVKKMQQETGQASRVGTATASTPTPNASLNQRRARRRRGNRDDEEDLGLMKKRLKDKMSKR